MVLLLKKMLETCLILLVFLKWNLFSLDDGREPGKRESVNILTLLS